MSIPLPFPLYEGLIPFYEQLPIQGQRVFIRIFSMLVFFYVYDMPYCGFAYEELARGLLSPDITGEVFTRLQALFLYQLGIFGEDKKYPTDMAEFLFIETMFQTFPPEDIPYYEQRAAELISFIQWDGLYPVPWPDIA